MTGTNINFMLTHEDWMDIKAAVDSLLVSRANRLDGETLTGVKWSVYKVSMTMRIDLRQK